MRWRNTTERYGAVSITLHWLMLLLLAAVYACMELNDLFPRGSAARAAMKTWHFMLGLSVLVLALVRLLLALTSPVPAIVPAPAPWQDLLAKAMKIALYAFMIGTPIAGWLLLSAKGQQIPFFGFAWPALIGESKSAAGSIKEVHELVANLGYFLIGGHAAAGVFHHYGLRDNTLVRIWPKAH